MAKVYAQKRDAAHCAEYLRKSLDEGYKDIATAATDPAFKDVINDPVVQEVMVRVVPAEQKGSATHPGALKFPLCAYAQTRAARPLLQ